MEGEPSWPKASERGRSLASALQSANKFRSHLRDEPTLQGKVCENREPLLPELALPYEKEVVPPGTRPGGTTSRTD